jgi:hypothetical protein
MYINPLQYKEKGELIQPALVSTLMFAAYIGPINIT